MKELNLSYYVGETPILYYMTIMVTLNPIYPIHPIYIYLYIYVYIYIYPLWELNPSKQPSLEGVGFKSSRLKGKGFIA